MKERVTFVLDPADADFDPKKLDLQEDSLQVSSLRAVREDRFTFSSDELPDDLLSALEQCHELHVRWASAAGYAARAPFSSRVSPGLHVFYTPQPGSADDLVCPALQTVLGSSLPCESPNRTFTAVPALSERFAASASHSYYAPLKVLDELVMYVLQRACHYRDGPCTTRLATLTSPDYLDADWDAASRALVVRAYSHSAAPNDAWHETFRPANGSKLEVGVLAAAAPVPALAENLGFGGYLSAVGQDAKPDAVEFTFASRHHGPPGGRGSYGARFVQPTGLHPTLRVSVSSPAPPAPQCRLNAFLTLPSAVFPDKYQLAAPLFLASKNLGPLRAVWGETDLEAPDWAVSRWGSSVLIELVAPAPGGITCADIPLHLRYLAPAAGGQRDAQVPWPVVFWACRAGDDAKLDASPFDRVHLGYDGLFAPRTVFYHLQPNASAATSMFEPLRVPVLDSDRTAWVPAATAAVLLAGVAWVLWQLLRVAQGPGAPAAKDEAAAAKKKD